MPDKYYQEYGPISRRRAAGTLGGDESAPEPEPAPELEPAPLPRPARRDPPRARPRRWRSLLGLLLFLLIAGAAILALPYATNVLAGDRAMDGISLAGQPLAGKNHAEIRALLEQRYGAFIRAPLTLTFEGRTWTPTLDQLGVSFDLDRIADDTLT